MKVRLVSVPTEISTQNILNSSIYLWAKVPGKLNVKPFLWARPQIAEGGDRVYFCRGFSFRQHLTLNQLHNHRVLHAPLPAYSAPRCYRCGALRASGYGKLPAHSIHASQLILKPINFIPSAVSIKSGYNSNMGNYLGFLSCIIR